MNQAVNLESAATSEVIAPPFGAGDREAIRRAIALGRVMTYPTETTYALGGNALSPALVESIYRLKGRDRNKPMLLLVNARGGLRDWVGGMPAGAEALMERFWPGPLTLVFPAGPSLPFHLPDARGTVALRWSPHPLVAELLDIGGAPLIGTSANLSGQPSLNDAQAVIQAFPAEPLLTIDGGVAAGSLPSTVLDVSVRPFRIVREGVISRDAIRDALGARFTDLAPAHAVA
ncbi:MAG TPA: L-threonylcarbamoyladenylate synthase [bacterium]